MIRWSKQPGDPLVFPDVAKRKDEPIEEMWVTRAEFEARFGYKPSKGAVGVLLYSTNGSQLCKVMFATPEDEVSTLEHLWGLGNE